MEHCFFSIKEIMFKMTQVILGLVQELNNTECSKTNKHLNITEEN